MHGSFVVQGMKRMPDRVQLAEPVETENAAAVSAGLAFQLEELLAAVWRAEANWRFDDRLDLACRDTPA
jgi:hypothetical protein